MKYWTQDILSDEDAFLPEDIFDIMEGANAALAEHLGATQSRLLRIGKYDSGRDINIYTVDLELASGVRIPVECGLVESVDEEWEDTDAESVVADVVETVSACRPLIDRAADALHDLRVRVRRIIAGWQRDGLQIRMNDVQLRPYDHWRGDTDTQFEILLEASDIGAEWLPDQIYLETAEALNTEMAQFHENLVSLTKLRRESLEKGASGAIEQIALNAIRAHGDVERTLQRFAKEDILWLPDDTALLFRRGKVDIGCGNSGAAPIEFHCDSIDLMSTFMPAARLRQAVGRPVTELFEHPFLSDDIIVTDAVSEVGAGTLPFVRVTISMPQRLFCTASGRVWDDVSVADAAPFDAAPEAGSNVVPFKPRRCPAAA